jgi:hypothetical protein
MTGRATYVKINIKGHKTGMSLLHLGAERRPAWLEFSGREERSEIGQVGKGHII